MNANDEMLHRLMDNELPDEGMREVFGALQQNRMLREQFQCRHLLLLCCSFFWEVTSH